SIAELASKDTVPRRAPSCRNRRCAPGSGGGEACHHSRPWSPPHGCVTRPSTGRRRLVAVITSTDQASRDRPAIALPDTARWAARTGYAVGDVVWALGSDGVIQRV